ncbi:D-glycero-alpha-D-manno-heptose-1,7-bisphosphate 7-phosphatase [Helicobacter cinaedi]|uniref:D-glycero-alpha-D-manno-heptose-1,7-bisphosphate 7-phosphatase n=1 Tax=Helicobacter cinaedi TaxID=213 RepID=UPI000CF0B51E|nr:HAD family hydrolase [Helicobacter cinaedi]
MQKCAFFDRDGVINEDVGYVYKQKDFIFCDGLFELLKTLKKQDYLLLVMTNQSGIARGYYTQEDLFALHQYMQDTLTHKLGFCFDRIYHCPHLPSQNCECRKPNIGMVKAALKDFEIDLKQSFFIGDNITDMQCAENAGIWGKFLLQKDEKNTESSQHSIKNLQKISTLHQLHSIIQANES